jgi:predicted nuclease of restriction endonuclease-like (RecB) superfamily
LKILTLSGKFETGPINQTESEVSFPPEVLLSRLSYSHFIELLNAETPLKRAFYEVQAIKNNWGIRELNRAMSTLLFERTGLSTNKEEVIAKTKDKIQNLPIDVVKNPYFLEFLGLEEKSEYSENDLEEAIINHLQKFLIELGRGFCFEARQKRITFNNKHYRIDLVFYNRILKCHVLLDLKVGEFDHADAGQMNVYLNYFRKNEMTDHDNPPVGIILCASKDNTLVEYATAGLSHEVFVSKYLVQLPTVEELKMLIVNDRKNYREK